VMVERQGAELSRLRFAEQPDRVRELSVRAIRGMIDQLTPNFCENRSWQRLVDLGHTFSSLLESRSEYRISHGQAVSVDMAFSAAIAVVRGRLSIADFHRILTVLADVGLPCNVGLLDLPLAQDALAAACLHRGGSPQLVVPLTIGRCGFVDDMAHLGPDVLRAALELLPVPA